MKLRLSIGIILFASQSILAAGLECRYIRPIQQAFLDNHITQKSMSTLVQDRTVEQLIKRFDGAKLYFYQSDVDKIKKDLSKLFEQVGKQRDCSGVYKVHALYLQRAKERAAFAKKFLANKSLKLDKNIELVVDADLRKYPKNEKEADAFQEKYMHFQLANLIATDMNLEEAKPFLERRYNRSIKQIEEMSKEVLHEQLLEAFANALDPHSGYFSADAQKNFQIQMGLSLEGIGATLSSQDGYTVIEQLIPGGAAKDSNQLQTKDKIIAVGQGKDGKLEPVIDLDLNEVVKKIRGPAKSEVTLKVLRKDGSGTKTFSVVLQRRKIDLENDAAKITYVEKEVNGKKQNVGILQLPSFYNDGKGGRSASADLEKLIVEAKKKKVDSLVLDMSFNGGGSLEEAVKVAGLFIRRGNIVEAQGSRLADMDSSVQYAGPLVVLINRFSASASEIVAGALQDYARAVVVGSDHTFGKGSVQTVMPLPEELGAMKVTVGLFFVPGGKTTQHGGVSSDIVFPDKLGGDDKGEKSLDYSLVPSSVKPFLSETAMGIKPEETWKRLDIADIKVLRQKSESRINVSEDFKKIKQEIKDYMAKKNIVKVADLLDDKNNPDKKEKDRSDMSDAEKNKEYLKRADVQESVNIAVDLLEIVKPSQVLTKSASVK